MPLSGPGGFCYLCEGNTKIPRSYAIRNSFFLFNIARGVEPWFSFLTHGHATSSVHNDRRAQKKQGKTGGEDWGRGKSSYTSGF
jgi:hypothetical protein